MLVYAQKKRLDEAVLVGTQNIFYLDCWIRKIITYLRSKWLVSELYISDLAILYMILPRSTEDSHVIFKTCSFPNSGWILGYRLGVVCWRLPFPRLSLIILHADNERKSKYLATEQSNILIYSVDLKLNQASS